MRLLLLALCLLAAPARAESFAPVGLWRGEASGGLLVVLGPGFCSELVLLRAGD